MCRRIAELGYLEDVFLGGIGSQFLDESEIQSLHDFEFIAQSLLVSDAELCLAAGAFSVRRKTFVLVSHLRKFTNYCLELFTIIHPGKSFAKGQKILGISHPGI